MKSFLRHPRNGASCRRNVVSEANQVSEKRCHRSGKQSELRPKRLPYRCRLPHPNCRCRFRCLSSRRQSWLLSSPYRPDLIMLFLFLMLFLLHLPLLLRLLHLRMRACLQLMNRPGVDDVGTLTAWCACRRVAPKVQARLLRVVFCVALCTGAASSSQPSPRSRLTVMW